MQLLLQVSEGPDTGRKISLRPGQTARVGRTEAADYCFSQDSGMSAVHFAVSFVERQWRVDDLQSTGGTWVNGKRVTRIVLQHGDLLRAGNSTFTVQLGGQSLGSAESTRETATIRRTAVAPTKPATPSAASLAVPTLPAKQGFVPTPVTELAGLAQVGEAALALASANATPQDYLAALLEHDLPLDAIRFLGQALPKRDLVQWSVRCVRAGGGDALNSGDAEALQLAEKWAQNPNEEARRAAHAAAESLEFGTAACWVAMAAFWSEGSMGPPQAPAVPADPTYAGQAAAGAVMLAAVAHEPEKASEKQRQFVQWGLEAGTPTTRT